MAKFKAEHRESGKRGSELKVARESKMKRITFDTNPYHALTCKQPKPWKTHVSLVFSTLPSLGSDSPLEVMTKAIRMSSLHCWESQLLHLLNGTIMPTLTEYTGGLFDRLFDSTITAESLMDVRECVRDRERPIKNKWRCYTHGTYILIVEATL